MKKALRLFVALLLVFALTNCGEKGEKREEAVSEEREEVRAKERKNTPPTIFSARITPSLAYTDDTLRVEVKSRDAEMDPIKLSYQWERNGVDIDGAEEAALNGINFVKGNVITVRVIPDDGILKGDTFRSEELIISNSIPEITSMRVTPDPAYSNSDLTVAVEARDRDDDTVSFTYQWTKNDEVIPEENSNTLVSSNFVKGDVIRVTATPTDGEAEGLPLGYLPITISNAPPAISSSPPQSLSQGAYTYQVKANDPDGDPMSFKLNQAPEGMTIDESSGLIQWRPARENTDSYEIEILVQDNDGGQATQKYTFNISFPEEGK
ncbi:MAG: hypothetical protein JSU92_08015 [Deltaproteobacteria bacterium]|nr:MAG: hypothetical protein JSU92_08015 [Deltaproteobacteria bacterium]